MRISLDDLKRGGYDMAMLPPEKVVEAPPGRWRVEIPGWIPPSVNKLVGKHWARGHKLKKDAARVIADYCSDAGVLEATRRRRVSIDIAMSGRGRLPDADNVLKATLDGLTACGALKDDGPAWLELGEILVRRGPDRRTVIVLEDI